MIESVRKIGMRLNLIGGIFVQRFANEIQQLVERTVSGNVI